MAGERAENSALMKDVWWGYCWAGMLVASLGEILVVWLADASVDTLVAG